MIGGVGSGVGDLLDKEVGACVSRPGGTLVGDSGLGMYFGFKVGVDVGSDVNFIDGVAVGAILGLDAMDGVGPGVADGVGEEFGAGFDGSVDQMVAWVGDSVLGMYAGCGVVVGFGSIVGGRGVTDG